MPEKLKIDYVEFNTTDIGASKDFAAKAFGWSYIDYGPGYADIQGAGLGGGFDAEIDGERKPPLVVLKAENLEAALIHIEAAGGHVTKAIFSFPGGRRFHFREPGGNELAVWSDK